MPFHIFIIGRDMGQETNIHWHAYRCSHEQHIGRITLAPKMSPECHAVIRRGVKLRETTRNDTQNFAADTRLQLRHITVRLRDA